MHYYIGLDIGGTKCAVLLATLDGGIKILDKIRFETHTENGFEYAYEKLCRSMEEILERNGITFIDVRAIGISCGGPLDSRSGVVLSPPNLPGWDHIPLPKMLKDRYGVEAFIQNDANACALVEWKLGAGHGTQNMIFLTMGTGMGAGVIAEGQLLRGNTDMGGEVGHLRLTEEGPVGFGKAGSFEGYTSGGGIGRQAQALTHKLIGQGKTPAWVLDGHKENEITARLIAEYAKNGDQDAIEFYKNIGKMLGRGLALLVDAFNPECIVIGSVFVRCGELMRESMEEELHKEALTYSLNGLRIEPAQTGEALGDLASIMVALNALKIDPLTAGKERDERVLAYYERLFERYPALESCRLSIMQAYETLRDCYISGGKVMLCGNGGSCADCGHILGELMKGFYLKRPLDEAKQSKLRASFGDLLEGAESKLQQGLFAIDLTSQTGLLTAVQNDLDAGLCYAQQVISYAKEGDVLLAISTSGNARNAALALAAARAMDVKTIGLSGGTGGKMAPLCDTLIAVPSTSTADVQELHLPVYHTLCAMLEARFFKK